MYGFNPNIFEKLNDVCTELDRGRTIVSEIKMKYKMLLNLLLDNRIVENSDTESLEYSFDNEGTEVRTVGFLKYAHKVINIPMNEIERMGKWLQDNQEMDIPKHFYSNNFKRVRYSIEHIKKYAKDSKQPLSSINKAYEVIKSVISQTRQKNNKNMRGSER